MRRPHLPFGGQPPEAIRLSFSGESAAVGPPSTSQLGAAAAPMHAPAPVQHGKAIGESLLQVCAVRGSAVLGKGDVAGKAQQLSGTVRLDTPGGPRTAGNVPNREILPLGFSSDPAVWRMPFSTAVAPPLLRPAARLVYSGPIAARVVPNYAGFPSQTHCRYSGAPRSRNRPMVRCSRCSGLFHLRTFAASMERHCVIHITPPTLPLRRILCSSGARANLGGRQLRICVCYVWGRHGNVSASAFSWRLA